MRKQLKKLRSDFYLWRTTVAVKPHFNVPFLKRIFLSLKGFKADQYVQYNFAQNDPQEYITAFERWKSREVDGVYNIVMDDKLIFSEIFGKYIPIPALLAWISHGNIIGMHGHDVNNESLTEFVRQEGSVVIKPTNNGGGTGVYVIHAENGAFDINGKRSSDVALMALVESCRDSIITRFIRQSSFGSALYPHATNTVRIIVVRQKGDSHCTAVAAIQRIGRDTSRPVDNCSMGALASEIDMQTGILGSATSYYKPENLDRLTFHDNHPDTGAPIKGMTIPNWPDLVKSVCTAADQLPYIKLIAWDIVITDAGLCAIEANASCGLDLLQVFRGCRNTALGQFYRDNGVIK